MTSEERFGIIEARIRTLLDNMSGSVSKLDREALEEYLFHGEYGLALESLWAILSENRVPVPSECKKELTDLAEEMRFPADNEFIRLPLVDSGS